MWPIMLDMTTEECRGILRRLELEAYSNLMSSFRAQGCLSDNKIKLLEELRTILHISIDRHRAEARRVANDEQLCTIAEALFGSNTGREWSIEGKRPFPLLPRGAAFTALNIVAEKGSEIGCDKNTKLPEPFETRRQHVTPSEVDQNKKVVVQDPLRFNTEKINLKRSLSLPVDIQPTSPANKKRGDILMLKHQTHSQQQFQQNIQMLSQQLQQSNQTNQLSHASNNQVHTNSRIQQLYHTHSKTQSRHKRGMNTKRGKGRTPTNRSVSIGVSGSAGDNKIEKRMKEKIIYPVIKNDNNELSGAPNIMNIELPVATPPLQSPTLGAMVEAQHIFIPQIATSKKDIASNLTKLNLNVSNNNGQNTVPSPSLVTTGAITPQSHAPQTHQQQKTMKIISSAALNIKLTNNILQKSLTGKIINSNQFDANTTPSGQSAIPIGSKINLQIQSANNKSITTSNQIPITLSPSHMQPMLTSPSHQSASQQINAATASGPISSSEHINLKISPQPELTSNLNVTKPPPKVQIISQQIIHSPNMLKAVTGSTNPLTTPIKIPSQQGNQVQLKTISTAGKNQLKLIPAGGKVLIKSSPANQKITGITQIKGGTATSTPNNLTNFQKVQLMPVKTDVSGKSNLILMQKINQTQVQGGPLRSVKLTKDMNKIIANATKGVTITPSKLNNMQTQSFNQNNVIVVGFQDTQQPQQQVQSNNPVIQQQQTESNKLIGKINSGVITEDTPVDIIPSINPNVTEEIIINGNLDGAQSTTKTHVLDGTKRIEAPQITDWEDELDHHTSNILKHSSKTSLVNAEGEDDNQNEGLLYELSHNTDEDEDDFIEEDHTLEDDEDVNEHDHNLDQEEEIEDDGVTEDYDDEDDDIIMVQNSEMENKIYGNTMESEHLNFGTYNMSGGPTKLLGTSGIKTVITSGGNTGDCGGGSIKRKIFKNNNKIVAVDDVEALMIEMHEIDDSSNRKLRNMTINDLIASGHIVTTESMVSPEIAEMANGDNVSE